MANVANPRKSNVAGDSLSLQRDFSERGLILGALSFDFKNPSLPGTFEIPPADASPKNREFGIRSQCPIWAYLSRKLTCITNSRGVLHCQRDSKKQNYRNYPCFFRILGLLMHYLTGGYPELMFRIAWVMFVGSARFRFGRPGLKQLLQLGCNIFWSWRRLLAKFSFWTRVTFSWCCRDSKAFHKHKFPAQFSNPCDDRLSRSGPIPKNLIL